MMPEHLLHILTPKMFHDTRLFPTIIHEPRHLILEDIIPIHEILVPITMLFMHLDMLIVPIALLVVPLLFVVMSPPSFIMAGMILNFQIVEHLCQVSWRT